MTNRQRIQTFKNMISHNNQVIADTRNELKNPKIRKVEKRIQSILDLQEQNASCENIIKELKGQ